MESYPTQAVLPLVGLAAEKVIRERYNGDPLLRRPTINITSRLHFAYSFIH
ncbi:MAG: hypothetical protein ACQESR_20915 [Planctomycetota bacterium]